MLTEMHMLAQADESDFQEKVLRSKEPTIALFHATWCPFCRAFMPIFEKYSSKRELRFVEVDISHLDSPLWDRYDIQIVPTIAEFEEGKMMERVDGIAGFGLTEKDLRTLIEAVEKRRREGSQS